MSWVFVKWIEEDAVGAIPSAWVLEPTPVPSIGFPIEALAIGKKNLKSSKRSFWLFQVKSIQYVFLYVYYYSVDHKYVGMVVVPCRSV